MKTRTGMKCAALGVAFLIVTGETRSPPATSSPEFCTRLAIDSGIERPVASDGQTGWTVSALNFGQRFLIGGTATTGVGVLPVEPATVEDYRRLDDMCVSEKKGAVCRLVGPVNFRFTWKGRKVVTPVHGGERATVSVAGTRATCRSGTDI